eukprot:Sspe_Gene.74656::Locus_46644_Transcript_1_1_Confidence_1.000_Length_729::g.74656::m.74656
MSLVLVGAVLVAGTVSGQPIPDSLDMISSEVGFAASRVRIELLGDYQCPDTKAVWDSIFVPLATKYGAKGDGKHVSLIYSDYPLPYHRNAVSSGQTALIVQDDLRRAGHTPSDAFMKTAAALFKEQLKFQTTATANMTDHEVVDKVLFPIAKEAGYCGDLGSFQTGMGNYTLNNQVRVAWKAGAVRGVYATPTWAVNGVITSGVLSWTLGQWEEYIEQHA